MTADSPYLLSAFVVALAVASGVPGRAVAAGKPGYPDKVVWNGVTWDIKTSRSPVGPGPNIFDKANVWTDPLGFLHLGISQNAAGDWTCAEVVGPTTYGYGTYTFTLASRVDNLDPNVVLGLFTWSDRATNAHREVDIEFARWGIPTDPTNAQYVVQPYDRPGHLVRFTQPSTGTSTHRFTWQKGRIDWESYDAAGALVYWYSYTGSDVPRSGDERVRLNVWLFNGAAPSNGQPAEVVISSFDFRP